MLLQGTTRMLIRYLIYVKTADGFARCHQVPHFYTNKGVGRVVLKPIFGSNNESQ